VFQFKNRTQFKPPCLLPFLQGGVLRTREKAPHTTGFVQFVVRRGWVLELKRARVRLASKAASERGATLYCSRRTIQVELGRRAGAKTAGTYVMAGGMIIDFFARYDAVPCDAQGIKDKSHWCHTKKKHWMAIEM
jgi:hypothetical protein